MLKLMELCGQNKFRIWSHVYSLLLWCVHRFPWRALDSGYWTTKKIASIT